VAPEQLLVLALLALVWLASALVNWLKARARRGQPDEAAETAGPAEVRPPPSPPPRAVVTPPRAVAAPPRAPAPAPPARVPRPARAVRPRGRFRVGGAEDVRRGIVLMTVLGPCRALEHDDRAREG
jgi:hypothetical protein